jgi:DNA-binding MarR family transcriptional regulator
VKPQRSRGDRYEAAAAVREALRLFDRRSEEITRRHQLTARSYELLLMVKTGREAPGRATPDELERRLQLAKSTVAELLQRNENQGLITRELHPHRRGAILIALTRKGTRRLEAAFTELGSERDRLAETLSQPLPGMKDPNERA